MMVALGATIGLALPIGAGDGPDASPRRFAICHSGGGTNCVVDGDTAWIDGVKVRVADIDAPETHPSRCAHEADLGDWQDHLRSCAEVLVGCLLEVRPRMSLRA